MWEKNENINKLNLIQSELIQFNAIAWVHAFIFIYMLCVLHILFFLTLDGHYRMCKILTSHSVQFYFNGISCVFLSFSLGNNERNRNQMLRAYSMFCALFFCYFLVLISLSISPLCSAINSRLASIAWA